MRFQIHLQTRYDNWLDFVLFCFKYNKRFIFIPSDFAYLWSNAVLFWEDKYSGRGERSLSGQHAQPALLDFPLLHIALPSATRMNILQNLCVPNPADIGRVGNSGIKWKKKNEKKTMLKTFPVNIATTQAAMNGLRAAMQRRTLG